MSGKHNKIRERFWERFPLSGLNSREWEALCDGCGRCCLNKLEDPDTGEVALTSIACRLLDDETCRCSQYDIRRMLVPECIHLTASTIEKHAYWLPDTCAYKRLWHGDPLPAWHALICGDADAVHDAGISMRGRTLPENEIPVDEWEDHIIEEIH